MGAPTGDFWQLLRGSGATFEAAVAGVSMLPTLADAARIRIEPRPADDYAVGDVVVCVLRDELYAHRIVRRCGTGGDACVVTLGDNRRLCDPPARVSDLLGRVEAVWRGGDWCPLPAAPRRGPVARALLAANQALLAGCAKFDYVLARRVAGALLRVAQLPRRAWGRLTR
jgi:hypothetical protein